MRMNKYTTISYKPQGLTQPYPPEQPSSTAGATGLYRRATDSAGEQPDPAGEQPGSTGELPESAGELPDNDIMAIFVAAILQSKEDL